MGIKIINVWSLLIKILSIAGSNNQAVAEVLAATTTESNAAKIIFVKNNIKKK